MRRLIAFSILGIVLLGGACKQNAAAPAKKNGADAVATPTTPAPQSPPASGGNDDSNGSTDKTDNSTDCTKPSSSSTNSASTDTSDTTDSDESLPLTSTTNYNDDIKSIVRDKCLSCHDSGGTPPDLSTYAKVKAKKSLVLSEIDGAKMPPSGSTKLTSTEKTTILSWLEAGAPQKASDSNTSSDTGTTDCADTSDTPTTDTADTDAGSDTDGDDTVAAWEELINPTKLKDCKDNGKIFDRSKDKCHRAKTASSYECTEAGITKSFKAVGITVTTQLDSLKSEGYEIDQCGEYNNEPIVYFRKKQESEDELKLLIRKICKKNSPACLSE